MGRGLEASFLVLVMLLAPLSGCFGEDGEYQLSENSIKITPEILIGGIFQEVTFSAEIDVSVFVPYLIKNKENGFVQNSTVMDLREGESVQLSVLAPPKNRHSSNLNR